MSQSENKEKRLQKIDIFRGLALIGMVIYHFSWDLSYFSYISPTVPAAGSLRILARIVAFCFIFTAGFSLYLAHKNGIRWKPFCKRLLIIILAAALVSFVTFFIMPQGFIYFGILHEIALTSLLALMFLYTPIVVNLLVALIIFALPFFYQSDLFSSPALLWLGLTPSPKPSFDYVPLFPWFSAGLFGLTIARLLGKYNALYVLQNGIKPRWLNSSLQWLGKHSLIFYLVHQPILLALLYGVSFIAPPSIHALREPMEQACVSECSEKAGRNVCTQFCSCVFDRIEAQNLLPDLSKGELTEVDERLQIPVNMCWSKIMTDAAKPQQ